jgi:hypothetical protein
LNNDIKAIACLAVAMILVAISLTMAHGTAQWILDVAAIPYLAMAWWYTGESRKTINIVIPARLRIHLFSDSTPGGPANLYPVGSIIPVFWSPERFVLNCKVIRHLNGDTIEIEPVAFTYEAQRCDADTKVQKGAGA